jgi:glycosyltransferase involved in cell wall biosynthesis
MKTIEKKVIFVNASNCHQGGGKILLDGFIMGINLKNDYHIFIDKRYKPAIEYSNVYFYKTNIYSRFFVWVFILKKINNNDTIFYFGNLPPFFNFKKNKVLLMLSSRFYLEKINMKGFTYSQKFKILLEKLYFNFFISNVSTIIVQTTTMKNLLTLVYPNKDVHVLPYDSIGEIDLNIDLSKKIPSTFLYVASALPYKNHINLLKAWNLLNEQGVHVNLYITIEGDNKIIRWMKSYSKKNNLNIYFLENLNRNDLIKYYLKCEYLIYPSIFESYGLPLIEANKYGLKIIASDLSYSFDLITPYLSFNPFEISSISRAVKKALNITDIKDQILDPYTFVNKIEQL